jgi:hypothetical protein
MSSSCSCLVEPIVPRPPPRPPTSRDVPQRDRAREGSRSAHPKPHDRESESAPVDAEAVFPATNAVPDIAQLGEAPFHDGPRPVVLLPCDDGTTAPGSPCGGAPPDWDTHADATASQEMAPITTVGPAIRHPLCWSPFGASPRPRDRDGVQSRLAHLDLDAVGAIKRESEREALAVDHHQPLGALALLHYPPEGGQSIREQRGRQMTVRRETRVSKIVVGCAIAAEVYRSGAIAAAVECAHAFRKQRVVES